MPIESIDGQTFVAFSDIAGFKMMMKDKDRAWMALEKFYSCGYRILNEQSTINARIEGFFISDCCVLFVRPNPNSNNSLADLQRLLLVIKHLNSEMINNNFFLTTSICFGKFKYQRRIELDWIEKSAVYGNAYVDAYIDNENGRPKLSPGLCRIIKDNLPEEIKSLLGDSNDYIIKGKRRKHYYYYWMLSDKQQIRNFNQEYKQAYGKRRLIGFTELCAIIKDYSNGVMA